MSPLDQYVTQKMMYFANMVTGILKKMLLWKGDIVSPVEMEPILPFTVSWRMTSNLENSTHSLEFTKMKHQGPVAGRWICRI